MKASGGFVYKYPRPMVTVDAVVFTVRDGGRHVLLIRRANAPYAGYWALPGGFVDENEPLDRAIARELEEETGLTGVPLEQFHAFGDPGRDPRGHNICIAYVGEAGEGAAAPEGGDDASDARWFRVDALPPLAFDHARIIEYALRVGTRENRA